MLRRVALENKYWTVGRCLMAGAVAIGLASPALAVAGPSVARPAVPRPAASPVPSILFPEGATPFLRTHAVGTQNYVCVVTGTGFAWSFIGPQATLFVDIAGFERQLTTHFLSPNPDEAGVARATWQSSIDTSRVWARATQIVNDPAVIGTGNIPWLLLQRAGAQRGPTGGGSLAQTTWIQRVRTRGGVAPSTGCSQSTHVGATALVPYSTDYVFFR